MMRDRVKRDEMRWLVSVYAPCFSQMIIRFRSDGFSLTGLSSTKQPTGFSR